MGFRSRVSTAIKRFARAVNLLVTDPKAWDRSLWNLAGAQSISGETVNEETALTYSPVFNAISLISGTVASLPLHLMAKTGGNKEEADNKNLFYVMHDQWNPYMTAMTGRECMMAHVLGWGNGYAEIVRNGYGEIIQLWPITPNRVTVHMHEGELVYVIRMPNGEEKVLERSRMLHIPGLGFDGFIGYSVIAMARKSIGLGMAMETFGARYFGNGIHPSAVLVAPGSLSAQARSNLEESRKGYAGLGESHRLMILEEGVQYHQISINPEDSQFLESRTFQIPDIARWFNLPPHKLKDLTKSSFNNIEAEQTSFVTDSILPWLIRLEQGYNMQLLTPAERRQQKLYFHHNFEGLLRANVKDRAEFYRTMWGIGAMSINEIRGKEDQNPIDGGDEHFVPLNMIPISKIEKYLFLKGATKQEKTDDNQ